MKLKIFVLLLFISCANIQAQDFHYIIKDTKHFFVTGKDVFTAPLHYDETDWIKFSSVVGLTAAGFLLDNSAQSLALHNKSSFNNTLFGIDRYSVQATAVTIGGIYLTGWLVNDPNVRELGVRLIETSAYASIITLFIKGVAGRSRPLTGRSHLDFRPLRFTFDQSSFPSGHATFAFAFSTVMANFYDNIYWKIGWYAIAALIGGARIYHNAHWISDVILGAAVGHFVGQFVCNHDLQTASQSNNDVSVNFSFPIK